MFTRCPGKDAAVEPEQRAELEEQIAAVGESTEQRMHETAKGLPDPKRAHS